MYAEIVNDSNRVIMRIMLPAFLGTASGQIMLEPKEMSPGAYILRLIRIGCAISVKDYIFKKTFYINEPEDKDWLVNYRTTIFKMMERIKYGSV